MRICDWSSDVCAVDLTRPKVNRACVGEVHTPVARQVTQGLEAKCWNVRLRTEGPAPGLRVEFLEAASSRTGSTGKADCSSLILVAPAAGRMALAALLQIGRAHV